MSLPQRGVRPKRSKDVSTPLKSERFPNESFPQTHRLLLRVLGVATNAAVSCGVSLRLTNITWYRSEKYLFYALIVATTIVF